MHVRLRNRKEHPVSIIGVLLTLHNRRRGLAVAYYYRHVHHFHPIKPKEHKRTLFRFVHVSPDARRERLILVATVELRKPRNQLAPRCIAIHPRERPTA